MMSTHAEIEYLRSQRLGRLATLTPHGNLQNSPVGFQVDEESGVISVFGRDLGNSRKFPLARVVKRLNHLGYFKFDQARRPRARRIVWPWLRRAVTPRRSPP